MRLTGRDAIEYAENRNPSANRWNDPISGLGKYADPTEDARENITLAEARDIASDDPGLIYIDNEPVFGTQALPACAAGSISDVVQGKLGLNCEEMALLNTPDGNAVVDAVIRRFGLADDYDPTTFMLGETLQAAGILTEAEAEWLDEG